MVPACVRFSGLHRKVFITALVLRLPVAVAGAVLVCWCQPKSSHSYSTVVYMCEPVRLQGLSTAVSGMIDPSPVDTWAMVVVV